MPVFPQNLHSIQFGVLCTPTGILSWVVCKCECVMCIPFQAVNEYTIQITHRRIYPAHTIFPTAGDSAWLKSFGDYLIIYLASWTLWVASVNCFGFIGTLLSQWEDKQYHPVSETSTRGATELLREYGEFYHVLFAIENIWKILKFVDISQWALRVCGIFECPCVIDARSNILVHGDHGSVLCMAQGTQNQLPG